MLSRFVSKEAAAHFALVWPNTRYVSASNVIGTSMSLLFCIAAIHYNGWSTEIGIAMAFLLGGGILAYFNVTVDFEKRLESQLPNVLSILEAIFWLVVSGLFLYSALTMPEIDFWLLLVIVLYGTLVLMNMSQVAYYAFFPREKIRSIIEEANTSNQSDV